MNKIIVNILDAIPMEQIYRYLDQKNNACKKQIGGSKVGQAAASRKAKKNALENMIRELVK